MLDYVLDVNSNFNSELNNVINSELINKDKPLTLISKKT